MVDWYIVAKLMHAFPRSFINYQGEIILHEYSNTYFILKNCDNELDVKCKVLEWCSRAAYKMCPYRTEVRNVKFHDFMLKGINQYLETNFTEEDMELIYTYLGNACNHKLTISFIESGYNLDLLRRKDNGEQ